MIRRTVQFDDNVPGWLLISQVEHARISGEIVRAWQEPFANEVILAIAHHDDGWTAWERSPQLDRSLGRPLSFLEMPIGETLHIWDGSIAAARRIGPLAGAIVAGHFIGLASGSEQASLPIAQTWLNEMNETRRAWLEEWRNMLSANTASIAERAQSMVYTSDLLSLWLCCGGPVDSVEPDEVPNAEMTSRSASVLGKYHFVTHSTSMHRNEILWQGTIDPWPFGEEQINFAATAIAAEARNYASWTELKSASWPVSLLWQLRKTLPDAGEC